MLEAAAIFLDFTTRRICCCFGHWPMLEVATASVGLHDFGLHDLAAASFGPLLLVRTLAYVGSCCCFLVFTNLLLLYVGRLRWGPPMLVETHIMSREKSASSHGCAFLSREFSHV
ncbi:hypothetical protein U1Q18_030774, partial [Sarracenia purpurea var. burkii]